MTGDYDQDFIEEMEQAAMQAFAKSLIIPTPTIDAADIALARRFLDKADEDFTFIDPEDIKRLARAVLAKVES